LNAVLAMIGHASVFGRTFFVVEAARVLPALFLSGVLFSIVGVGSGSTFTRTVACRSAMDLIFIFPTLDILFTYNK